MVRNGLHRWRVCKVGAFAGPTQSWGYSNLSDNARFFSSTKLVVQSGLALNLDAGVLGSYPGSGTAWTDLSGNGRNGTLTNMDGTNFNSANGGSLTFDGSDEFVQCSGSLTLTAATFIVWIRRNGTQGFFDGILLSRGTSVTGINFRSTTNQLGYHWNATSNTYNWVSGLLIPDLSWCMVVVSVTSSSATAYLYQASGLTTATNAVSHSSTTLDDIKIAWEDQLNENRYFTGNIAQALIYNRALTAAEIQQNFIATRSRFGI
jgi:hypothetical protein